MSSTSSRPADQPNHRRTARNVIRASSAPESTCQATPVSSRTRASTSAALVASRTADVAKASRSSASSPVAAASGHADRLDQAVRARLGQRAVGADLLGQPQHHLL